MFQKPALREDTQGDKKQIREFIDIIPPRI